MRLDSGKPDAATTSWAQPVRADRRLAPMSMAGNHLIEVSPGVLINPARMATPHGT